MDDYKEDIADVAARMVVEEGLEYGPAKRQAAKHLGLSPRTPLPSNEQVELAVEEYIRIFCADTQPEELRVLRELALRWMLRLEAFRPHLGGAVWRGTATRHSDIYLHLFCDDSKAAELALLDQGVRFEVTTVSGLQGRMVDALSIHQAHAAWGVHIGIHLLVGDFDDLRGALQPDARGRRLRGDAQALQKMLHDGAL